MLHFSRRFNSQVIYVLDKSIPRCCNVTSYLRHQHNTTKIAHSTNLTQTSLVLFWRDLNCFPMSAKSALCRSISEMIHLQAMFNLICHPMHRSAVGFCCIYGNALSLLYCTERQRPYYEMNEEYRVLALLL